MPIAQTKYINIESATVGGSAVSQRELIGRVFTTNYLVPVNTVVEFDGGATAALASVGEYFGTTSEEYKFAEKYFGFQSKKGLRPKKIGFARYVAEAVPATVIGKKNPSLADLQAVTAGELEFNLDGSQVSYKEINLSSATSLADVARLINEKISGGELSCEYDAENARFAIKTTSTGGNMSVMPVATDLGDKMGLTFGIVSESGDAKSATDTVAKLEQVSNNFFSFAFLMPLSDADVVALAKWTDAQNIRYMFSLTVDPTNVKKTQELVKDYDGVCLTLDIYKADAGFIPMAAIAAIDYTRPNANIDMMYQMCQGVEPSVDDNEAAKEYDAIRVNYYGATQQAGRPVAFYQDGVLQGEVSSIGVYANEAWLKDTLFSALLNLRLGLDSLPASNTGRALVMGTMADVIEGAKVNGVIQIGKALTNAQKSTITEITGDEQAWMTVQSEGCWLAAEVERYTENGVEKFKISYLLVYSKGDSINFIDGRDILI